jgi:hypothetical protein
MWPDGSASWLSMKSIASIQSRNRYQSGISRFECSDSDSRIGRTASPCKVFSSVLVHGRLSRPGQPKGGGAQTRRMATWERLILARWMNIVYIVNVAKAASYLRPMKDSSADVRLAIDVTVEVEVRKVEVGNPCLLRRLNATSRSSPILVASNVQKAAASPQMSRAKDEFWSKKQEREGAASQVDKQLRKRCKRKSLRTISIAKSSAARL